MPDIQIPGPGSAMGLAAAVGIYSVGIVVRQSVESGVLSEKPVLYAVIGGMIAVVVAFAFFAYWIEKIHIEKEKTLIEKKKEVIEKETEFVEKKKEFVEREIELKKL